MVLTESTVEEAVLLWLTGTGWTVAYGPDIARDTPNAERDDYREGILEGRLRSALVRLSPGLPAGAIEDALRRLVRPAGATLEPQTGRFIACSSMT